VCKDTHIIYCYLYFHLFFIVVIKILLNNIYGYILETIKTIKSASNGGYYKWTLATARKTREGAVVRTLEE